MTPWTVLSVAWPFGRVGPDAIGGAEQILSHLDRALVSAGHRSIVVARAGSDTAGELVPTRVPDGVLTDDERTAVRRSHLEHIEGVLARNNVDVIHLHGLDFHTYLPRAGVPALVTLHLPPDWYPRAVFWPERHDTWLHCVSEAQRRRCPQDAVLLPVVENGVAIGDRAAGAPKERFALAIGRICPEKNFHTALDAGARAGVPVVLAGDIQPFEAHQRYFREHVSPRLDGMRRYIGPVGGTYKRVLMTSARCVLVPSLAPETSSLVAMEAMACGTPVVAFRSGALPEIVEDGVTGFLVRDEAEMVDAIHAAHTIDPEVCRDTARRRFSAERMFARYLEVYGTLASGASTTLVRSC